MLEKVPRSPPCLAVLPSEKRLANSPKSSPFFTRWRSRRPSSSTHGIFVRLVFGAHKNLAHDHLLGADKIALVLLVILLHIGVIQDDPGAHLAAGSLPAVSADSEYCS